MYAIVVFLDVLENAAASPPPLVPVTKTNPDSTLIELQNSHTQNCFRIDSFLFEMNAKSYAR